jgi:hypothetical protein
MVKGSTLTLGAAGVLVLLATDRRRPVKAGSRSRREEAEDARSEAELAALSFRDATRRLPPLPLALLDSGSDAYVFDTTNPDVVVRVASRGDEGAVARQELLSDEDFSGGVVKILFAAATEDSIVTWKERLNPNVAGFILKRYAQEPAKAEDLQAALLGLAGLGYQRLRERVKVLSSFPETAGLARALLAGMPAGDLDLNHNLGVTKDGRIVAYDL